MTEFKLPEEITPVKEVDPTDLIIVSPPKMGKTTILAELTKEENAAILSLEQGGTDYVSGRIMSCYPTSMTSFEEACKNYTAWRDALLKQKGKYKYLVVDSLTALDEISELMGTYAYMYGVPQGKTWNRHATTGKEYKYGDPNFRLITTMGEGYGYQHTRKWFMDQIDIFKEIAPYRIYTAHFRDKLISNGTDEVVTGLELNLTGKLRKILPVNVASLARLISDGDKRLLSFIVDNENVIAGSRASSLEGTILISEKIGKGNIKTYWNNIYTTFDKKKEKSEKKAVAA